MLSLADEELLGKLVLVYGSDETAPELRQLAIPTMHLDGVFMVGRPLPPTRMLPPTHSPISPLGSARSQSTTGGLTSPGSEINSQAAMPSPGPTVTPGKPIDPTKVRGHTRLPLRTVFTDLAKQPLHKREASLPAVGGGADPEVDFQRSRHRVMNII